MIRSHVNIKIFTYVVLFIFLAVTLFPLYWMVNTAFKTQFEVVNRIPTMYPHEPSVEGFLYLFNRTGYLKGLFNSFRVALVTTLFSIIVGYPAGYALSRLKFRGRTVLAKCVLFTYLIPTSVLYIPLYLFVSRIGLTNNPLGLMLIYPTFTLPYAIWMMIPNIGSVPKSLEEASIVDGCTRMQTMLRIVFPLCSPSIFSIGIFCFSMCWGEYLYALVNISSTKFKPFTLIIAQLIFGDVYPWPQLMAGAVMACVPLVILYMIASRKIVGGVTAGAVKQ